MCRASRPRSLVLTRPASGCSLPTRAPALDKNSDNDTDGIGNLGEFTGVAPYQWTNPCMGDTDGDGRTDGEEVNDVQFKSDPNDVDSDDDNLSDCNEVQGIPNPYGPFDPTDPENPDTDGDGLWDGVELNTPLTGCSADAGLFDRTNPNNPDTDGDGLSDYVEDFTLTYLDAGHTGTCPNMDDTDADGMPDWYEVGQMVKYPTCTLNPAGGDAFRDADGDGLKTGPSTAAKM